MSYAALSVPAPLDVEKAKDYNVIGLRKCRWFEYQEAIKDFDEAIRLNPKDPMFYYNRGCVKCQLGKYSEAISDLVDLHKTPGLDPAINIKIYFTVSKQALFDYLILLPDDEGKPLLRDCLDETTVLGRVMSKGSKFFESNFEKEILTKISDYLKEPPKVAVTLPNSKNQFAFLAKPNPLNGEKDLMNPVVDHCLHPL